MLTAQEPCVRLARKSTLLYAGYTARAGVATKVPWRSPTWLKVLPTEPVRSSERSKLLSAETLAVNRALNGRRAPVGATVARSEERRVGKACVSKCRTRWGA